MQKSEFLRRIHAAGQSYAKRLDMSDDVWGCAEAALREAGLPAHRVRSNDTMRACPLMTVIVHCHHATVAPLPWLLAELEKAWEHFSSSLAVASKTAA
jgi:hypothetical protein